ncbi:MAG TPA: hypothetical protein VMW62_04075, partial [Chloroflexota bacterium]|nr:hypothetical protein [Chloroflexota bacterium]
MQHTTGGLLAWRKSDNWTAFTDGYHTWVNGPMGIQERLNTDRFPFEHDTNQLAVSTPAPVAPEAPTPVVKTYPGWDSNSVQGIKDLEREALSRAYPPFTSKDIDDPGFLNSLGDKKAQLLQAIDQLDAPSVDAAKVTAVKVITHGVAWGWWYPDNSV